MCDGMTTVEASYLEFSVVLFFNYQRATFGNEFSDRFRTEKMCSPSYCAGTDRASSPDIRQEQSKEIFSILSFRRVLYVVCFLLGISPASEVLKPTFRNPLSVPSSSFTFLGRWNR